MHIAFALTGSQFPHQQLTNQLSRIELCKNADFDIVSMKKHTPAHVFSNTLLFACMHTALALCGSYLPDDTNSLQNNLLCFEICNSAIFKGVWSAKDTHH